MSVSVKIEIDSAKLARELNKTQAEISRDIKRSLRKTAQFGNQIIQERTAKGVGYTGKFEPYSEGYQKVRAKRGRKIAPVDLNFTGKMLGSIADRLTSKTQAEIYFTRASEAKKAAFNNKSRPFFGFNMKERDRLQRFFNKEFAK